MAKSGANNKCELEQAIDEVTDKHAHNLRAPDRSRKRICKLGRIAFGLDRFHDEQELEGGKETGR